MCTNAKLRCFSALVGILLLLGLATPTVSLAAQPTVKLGTTSTFAVLAGSTITNTGPTTINGSAGGDVGLHPGTSFTGQADVTLTGAVHLADGVASVAKDDLVTAYDDAAGRTPVTRIPSELGGTTLVPGVYDSADGTFQITGPLTLDAQGDPNGVFVFKTASTLITASDSTVNLINSARFCRVFWKVGSSATLGTNSHFAGHIFALTSISANSGATVQGQLLARNGAVTLDTNTITNGLCATSTAGVAVTKTLAPGQDAVVRVGDSISYVISVTNDGETTLTTVPLSDTFDSAHLSFVSASTGPDSTSPGLLTWNDLTGAGGLAPLQSTDVTVTFVATALGGSVTDTATVNDASNAAGDIAPSAWATQTSLEITNPHVNVAKGLAVGQPAFVPLGGTITYAIVVTNDGDTTLTTVPLSDRYDSAHLSFLSAQPGPTATTLGQLDWTDVTGPGSLAPGQSVTVTARFLVTAAAASVADTATVSGVVDVNGDTSNVSEATNVVVGTYLPSSLSVTKTAGPQSGAIVVPGQVITYRIAYDNSSPTTIAAAALVDHLSPAVTYQAGTLVLNSAPISDVGNYDPLSRTVDVALGQVPPGAAGMLSFRVQVGPWTASRAGIRNVGSWTANDTVVATTSPVYHYVDSLDITKTVANTSGTRIRTGSVLRWTIVVTNRGIVPATNVVVSDVLPAHTTYVKYSVTGPGSFVGQVPPFKWKVGTIGVGRSVTLTFRSTVNDNVNNGLTIWNRAWERSDQSPAKSALAVAGRVNDTTTAVAQTSGDENVTLGLVGLLGALSLGFAWSARPRDGDARRRGARVTVALLLSAMVAIGGMEVGAALGLPLPSPGEAIAAATGGGKAASYPTTGRVILPTVGIDQRLVEGSSAKALGTGLWHQPPSAKPGTAGACVIAGHRVSSQFARLHLVKVGDRLWVKVGARSYKYRVASVSSLRADGATLAFRTGATEKLILYTCLPRWQGNKRTVVVCYRTLK